MHICLLAHHKRAGAWNSQPKQAHHQYTSESRLAWLVYSATVPMVSTSYMSGTEAGMSEYKTNDSMESSDTD